jgi:hypothetical protein
VCFSEIDKVISNYFSVFSRGKSIFNHQEYVYDIDNIRLLYVKLVNVKEKNCYCFDQDIVLEFELLSKAHFENLSLAVSCTTNNGFTVYTARSPKSNLKLELGNNKVVCTLSNNLRAGNYFFDFGISIGEKTALFYLESCFEIEILDFGIKEDYSFNNKGVVNVESEWQKIV